MNLQHIWTTVMNKPLYIIQIPEINPRDIKVKHLPPPLLRV